jgi:dsDNA-specific endonuclease/ATPase MutS2
MMRAAEALATNEDITWREARYLARVVQILVASTKDREGCRRELDHLLLAAEALREASSRESGRATTVRDTVCDLAERKAESAAEGAVVELWRSSSYLDHEAMQATGAVAFLWRSKGRGSRT